MPAHNEKSHIAEAIRETAKVFQEFDCEYEIVVVDDGSTDGTFEEAKRKSLEIKNVKAVGYEPNLGKGFAMKHGFQYVTGDLVLLIDSDLDLPPRQVEVLYNYMKKHSADVVVGSKRHPDSTVNYPLRRKIYSDGYYLLTRSVFGLPVKDTQAGIKLYRYEVLKDVMPRILVKRFAFDLEILANAQRMGYKIVEAPISLIFKKKFGKINRYDAYKVAVDTAAIIYRTYLLRYYDDFESKGPLQLTEPINACKIGGYVPQHVTSQPKVSIIIPAKCLDEKLQKCIKECKLLDYPDFEIILLIDGDYPPIEGVKLIRTGTLSPPEKRDIGSREASGEILAFIDSDAYPRSDWLKEAIPHLDNPKVAAVGGPSVTPPDDTFLGQAAGYVYSSRLVSGNVIYRYVARKAREVDDFPVSNFLVKKADFDSIGGFGSAIWPGDDTLLCFKLTKRLNKKIVYSPHLVAYHYRRPLFISHLKQVWGFAKQRGLFAKRFPETSRRRLYLVPSLLLVAFAIGLPLSFMTHLIEIIYLSFITAYLLLIAFFSIRRGVLMTLVVMSGTVLTHHTYGLGFISGLLFAAQGQKS